jgi:hypothetical protein
MPIGKIFIAGIVFLFLTILINAAASAAKLTSWYTFLGTMNSAGWGKAMSQLSLVSALWLFVGYPFALGLLVYVLRRIFS